MYRIVENQNGVRYLYQTPDTEHWARWHDADAVVCHGQRLAINRGDRWEPWYGSALPPASEEEAEEAHRLKTHEVLCLVEGAEDAGITTRL